jgi:hypothetical protein
VQSDTQSGARVISTIVIELMLFEILTDDSDEDHEAENE